MKKIVNGVYTEMTEEEIAEHFELLSLYQVQTGEIYNE